MSDAPKFITPVCMRITSGNQYVIPIETFKEKFRETTKYLKVID